jgi:iron complex outermembrane receptor protein
LALSLPQPAVLADSQDYAFSIKPKSYAEELVDFAIQANISIGGMPVCTGQGHGLQGRYSIEAGLRKLLDGAPCSFSLLADRTVQLIAGAPAPRAAPAPELSEIVITATKRSVLADRLPAAVSTISGDQLLDRSDFGVTGTASQISGMSMTNLGPGRDKILLRGLSDGTFTGRTQSTVGTYLDDLPINYNAPDPDLRLADVEAVEVVRGPQGALYGSGSLSGLYRIVTRKPDMDRYGGDLTLSESFTQNAAGSHSAEGMANLPLLPGQAALRMVGYGELDGGYLGNSDTKQSDVDRTDRYGGRATLQTRLSDNWQVALGETYQKLNSADAQYTVMGAGHLTRANRVAETQGSDFSQTALTVTETGAWGKVESSTGYVHHAFANRYDASAALSLFDDTDSNDLGIYNESTRIDMLVEDLVATSGGNGPWQWLAGVFGSSTREKTISILNIKEASGPPSQRYREDRTDQWNELAPYGELGFELAPGWSASAGLRYFVTDLTTDSQVTLVPPAPNRLLQSAADFRGWAPKFTVQHDFAGGDMAYVLVSEGYRAGGFNAGGLSAPLPSRVTFEPDHLTNYEVGAKVKQFAPWLEIRSALFCDLWGSIQTDQYLASGLSYTANVGDARIFGLENDITLRPLNRLTVEFNSLFDTARITEVNPNFATHVTSGLPGVPDVSIGGLATYDLPLDDEFTLQLVGGVTYIGRSRLTFDPAQSPSMGGYVDAKLSAALKTDSWRITALVTNPADASGDTFAFGNPFSFGQVRQVTPLRPRTISLILSASF